MIIVCKNCNTKYSINKKVLGKNGKKVRCSNCGYEWYQKPDIIKKGLQDKSLKEEKIFEVDPSEFQGKKYNKKETVSRKLFSSDVIEKKKNYSFLYLFIFIILILFIYLNNEDFNYNVWSLNDPHVIQLSDGRLRMYVTALVEGDDPEGEYGHLHKGYKEVLVSAITK